jgi:hypothetical protein
MSLLKVNNGTVSSLVKCLATFVFFRSSLKLIGVAGEPMNHEAWDWLHRLVGEGRCDVVTFE